MLNHLFRAKSYAAQATSGQAAQECGDHPTKGGLAAAMYHVLTALGVTAICVLALMFVKPDVADRLMSLSPYVAKATAEQNAELARLSSLVEAPPAVAEAPVAPQEEAKPYLGNERQQRWVTNWLAKRYRVASDAGQHAGFGSLSDGG